MSAYEKPFPALMHSIKETGKPFLKGCMNLKKRKSRNKKIIAVKITYAAGG
jgi:hypothetical protein